MTGVLALTACSKFDKPEFSEVQELVAKTSEVVVAKEGGTGAIVVYANGDVTVRQLNETGPWASLNKTSFNGDDTLKVTFAENAGFRRMMKLELSLANTNKLDTITFKQDGIAAYLECVSPFRTVDGQQESSVNFEISTNVDAGEIKDSVNYVKGGTNWIKSISAEENILTVETRKSTVETISKARIDLSYVDGWGVNLNVSLMVTSSDKDGEFGTAKTFDEVKQLVGISRIEEDYYIKGIVVSDWRSKNLDVNPSVNYDQVDVTESDRTAYIETLDGSTGFKLKFDNVEENVLNFGTELTLGLMGTTVSKDNETVDAYTITGVTVENMLKSEVSTVPAKVKKISELTDADINTFVEIPNTEFVWKTGAYTNVYENYALKSDVNKVCTGNNNRFDGWAALMVDNENHAIFAPINMLCLWRRDGKGVPQGVGSTKGIVVNNILKRYGDVGRYQIRVLDQTGFCQSWDGESSYETLAKWDGSPYQYKFSTLEQLNPRYKLQTQTTSGFPTIAPSDDISNLKTTPNGEMTFQVALPASNLSTYHSHCSKFVTNTGAGDRGRASAGQGLDTYPMALQLNNDIKGYYEWDGATIVGYNGITLKVNTKDLTGTGMYMSYAFCVGEISATTSRFFPAHWCTEYSIDGGKTYTLCKETATGNDFCHLHALPWYDVNIDGIKYFSCSSCGLGSTEHLAFIPDDVFGKEDVRIRFRPYDDVMAIFPIDWDGEVEASHVYSTSKAQVYFNLEYAMIRYRK